MLQNNTNLFYPGNKIITIGCVIHKQPKQAQGKYVKHDLTVTYLNSLKSEETVHSPRINTCPPKLVIIYTANNECISLNYEWEY